MASKRNLVVGKRLRKSPKKGCRVSLQRLSYWLTRMRKPARTPSERWQRPSKWDSPDTIDAIFALEREYREVLDVALSAHGVTYAQFSVLRAIEMGADTLQQLADHFGYTRPNASKLVRSLVGAGLIQSSHDPSDKRKVTYRISAHGTRVYLVAAATLGQVHSRVYAKYLGYHNRFQAMIMHLHASIRWERKRRHAK
jgi:DNA-binding MarR family transcriptional regulator